MSWVLCDYCFIPILVVLELRLGWIRYFFLIFVVATHCYLQVRNSKDYSKINFWWTIPLKSYQSHTISLFMELMPTQVSMKLIFLNFCNLRWGIFKYDINTEEWLAQDKFDYHISEQFVFCWTIPLKSHLTHTTSLFFSSMPAKSLPTKLLFPKLSISLSKILIVLF